MKCLTNRGSRRRADVSVSFGRHWPGTAALCVRRHSRRYVKSVIFSILLPVAILATGCAHAHPTVSSDWSRIEAYLATLHVGMTPKVAERELQQWDCVPVGTLSSVLSHRQSYIFLSDGSVVILQYDEHDRLISWEGKQGHGTPPNPQGGANGRQPGSSETDRTPATAASHRSP